MEWTIQLFGPPAQAAGRSEVRVSLDGAAPTSAHLRVLLPEVEPTLRPFMRACRLAVNHRYAPDEQLLRPGDELALIGMVSGG